jgi:hypothetical protein
LAGGEILLLARIGAQVEELEPLLLEVEQQLVVPGTDGGAGTLAPVVAVVRKVPEERVARRG